MGPHQPLSLGAQTTPLYSWKLLLCWNPHYVYYWLLSTVNLNPPDQGTWIRPDIHPCQVSYKDIPDSEIVSDYVDLLNTVQKTYSL
jgi:hypothetical protein